MRIESPAIVGGFDCHKSVHVGAVLDAVGHVLGTRTFPATRIGYYEALAWLRGFGHVHAIGVESTGSYGAALTRVLRDAGERVVEINQPHHHTRARRGKSDAIDAEAAARKVLSGEATGAAKDSQGIVEAIRQLRVARDGAMKARTAAMAQLGDLLVAAPTAIREQLHCRKSLLGKATMCAAFRLGGVGAATPMGAARLALRSVAKRIAYLTDEAAAIAVQLDELVACAAPATRQRLGLGTQNTATLLVAAGENIDRLHSEAAFAHLCAVAPIPASSGQTMRHRLNRNGNRQANRALHMAVVVRLRYCPRTKAYLARRVQEGHSKREVMRCLKRYLAREVYRSLRTDMSSLAQRT